MEHNCKQTLFSIIVPIYNKEDYLRQCVDSVLRQSCLDFQLILVDDGSTDSSPQICDEYADFDARIKVIHKENGGLVSARKAGAEVAIGEYVINIDSDDYISDNALESIKTVIDNHSPDIVGFKFMRFNDDGFQDVGGFNVSGGFYDSNEIKHIKQIFIYNPQQPYFSYAVGPNLCLKAIKANLYVKWQSETLNTITMGEDLSVFAPCLLESKTMYLIDEPLYFYRMYGNSITATYRKNEFDNLYILVNYLKDRASYLNFDIHYQLSAYITYRVFEIIVGIASNTNSYLEFKLEISRMHPQLFNYVREFKAKKNGIKSYVIPFTIKHKFWLMYWLNYHKKCV